MRSEIIAVGSEMLTPERTDTNSLWLTDQLNNLGVEVVFKCVVGDDRELLAETVRRACSRSQIVILTGGLGPTEDDVTRDAVALALDRKQIFHPDIASALEERFRKAGRTMAENNKRQAMIIQGADPLPNDRGTAPGQWVDDAGVTVMLLPGPPHEMKAMFERQVLHRLARKVPKKVIRTLALRITGMGESDLDALIAPVYTKYANPVTTVLAHAGDLQVHFRATCATEGQAIALLAEVGGPVEQLLGDKIYSRNGDTLETVIGQMLTAHKATLAVAESATAGGLAARITSVPGSSHYFAGGFITYTRKLKTDLLGVSPDLLAAHGAVSREVAEAMADGARRRTGATHGLSVTGLAGPGSEDGETAPIGTVHVAVADAAGVRSANRQFLGDRSRIRQFAGQLALDLLRRRLAGL